MNKFENFYKLSILGFILLFMGITLNRSFTLIFLFWFFIFFINIKLRQFYKKSYLNTLSLLIDFILVYLIYIKFGEITNLLLLITLYDAIFSFKKPLAFLAVIFIFSNFLLYNSDISNILINMFIYLSFSIFIYNDKKSKEDIHNLQYLYDDVRRYSYELENAKKQIEVYSKKVSQLSALQERNIISEEIHDTIGHRLTALLFQLEAASRINIIDKEKSISLINQSIQNLRECIDVLRDTVHGMKPKDYKTLSNLIWQMLEGFKDNTEINISFKTEGDSRKLLPGTELVLYKNIQEAVTNSLKYSSGDKIIITLIYEKKRVTALVKDNGECNSYTAGMGISNMKERANFLGGSLNITCNDGFTVETIIPL